MAQAFENRAPKVQVMPARSAVLFWLSVSLLAWAAMAMLAVWLI